MIQKTKILFLFSLLVFLCIPFSVFAANSAIQEAEKSGFSIVKPCTKGSGQGTDEKKSYSVQGSKGTQTEISEQNTFVECGYADLINLINRIIGFAIFFGTTAGVISIAYAGFLYASAAGNSGQVEKAHHIFTMVVIGLCFMYGGWLIVATIMKTLGVTNGFDYLINTKEVQEVKEG